MLSIADHRFAVGVFACIVALGGQLALREGGHAPLGWLLFVCGALLFVVSCGSFVVGATAQPHASTVPPLPSGRGLSSGLALLASSLVVSAVAAWRFHETEPDASLAWWLHVAAVTLTLAGAVVLDRAQGPRPIVRAALPVAWRVALFAAVVAAAALRYVDLDVLPFGVWYDEAAHGLQALRILHDATYRPVFEDAITGPAHYLYLAAATMRWLGPGVESVRFVSATFGVLAVIAGYLVAAELVGRRLGVITAWLLAVSSWSLTLSRLGMYATMSTPLFTLLTAAFLLRATRTHRVLDYVLAGLALGLGLCFYTSFRLFVPVAVLFLIHWAVHRAWFRREAPPRIAWLGVTVLALAAATVVMPLVVFALKHPDVFWARVGNAFIFAHVGETERWSTLIDSLRQHLLMFNVAGDRNGRHNLPGAPMLDAITGALFFVGTLAALRRWTDPRCLLLLSWLFVMLMAGVLSLAFEAPQSLRANGTLPAAYLLAMLPVAALARARPAGAAREATRAWGAVALLLLACVAAINVHRYFVRQATDFAVWNDHSTPETIAARLIGAAGDGTDAYVTVFFQGHPTLRFVAGEAPSPQSIDTLEQFPLDFREGRGALIVVNAESRGVYDDARRLYPRATFEEVTPPFGGPPVLFVARLTADDVESIRGLSARYVARGERGDATALTRTERQVSADWTEGPPVPLPFTAEWDGALHVRREGVHEFVVSGPSDVSFDVAGRAFSGSRRVAGQVLLARGTHALRVRAAGGEGRVEFVWRQPGEKGASPVPSDVLYNAPVLTRGLLGRYFGTGDWSGPEVARRIESRFDRYVHIVPFPRPYSVEWAGSIEAPVAGRYTFFMMSIDESALWIDGRPVVRVDTAGTTAEGSVDLRPGRHPIRIRFADRTSHTQIRIHWQPPGAAGREVLPADVLFPPETPP